jgi:hypothetical protein
MFADLGNTSGLNQSRADDPSGMPRLAILNGTSNHSRLFVQVTAIAILPAPHLGVLPESVYVDPGYYERHREFQEVIHPNNYVEAIRMAMISSMLKCRCHCNVNNCSSVPGTMLVLILSRFVSINDVPCRSSVITYSRKIITSYGRMTKTPYYQCLNAFVTYYQLSANQSRRVIGHNLFVKPTVPWKPSQIRSENDFGMFLTPCHFNLHHYLSSFIHFLKELQLHLGLGYVEMACLVYCVYLKETSLFFIEKRVMFCPSIRPMRTCSHGAGVFDLVMVLSQYLSASAFFEKQVLRTGDSLQISRQLVPKRWFHIRPWLFYLSVSRDFHCSQLFGSLATGSYSANP